MTEIVNKFLLARDKFMPEMHLRQPGFTYSGCESFIKNRKRIYFSKKLEKDCFQHEAVYWDFKDLPRGTASDKILRDKAFNIAKNKKNMMDIKEVLLQWFMKSLITSIQVV